MTRQLLTHQAETTVAVHPLLAERWSPRGFDRTHEISDGCLAVHQMGGFDTAAVRAGFGLDDSLTPVVVIAVGQHDPAADLPAPLAARESAPRTRLPLSDLLLPEHTGPGLAVAA
jgi:hypothetical protein